MRIERCQSSSTRKRGGKKSERWGLMYTESEENSSSEEDSQHGGGEIEERNLSLGKWLIASGNNQVARLPFLRSLRLGPAGATGFLLLVLTPSPIPVGVFSLLLRPACSGGGSLRPRARVALGDSWLFVPRMGAIVTDSVV